MGKALCYSHATALVPLKLPQLTLSYAPPPSHYCAYYTPLPSFLSHRLHYILICCPASTSLFSRNRQEASEFTAIQHINLRHIFNDNYWTIPGFNQLTYLQLFWKDTLVQWALQFAFWWLPGWAKNVPWAVLSPVHSTFTNSILQAHHTNTHVSTETTISTGFTKSVCQRSVKNHWELLGCSISHLLFLMRYSVAFTALK